MQVSAAPCSALRSLAAVARKGCWRNHARSWGGLLSVPSYLLECGTGNKAPNSEQRPVCSTAAQIIVFMCFIYLDCSSLLFQGINLAGLCTAQHLYNLTRLIFLKLFFLFLGLKIFRLCNGSCIAQETNYSLQCFPLRQSPLIFNC